MAAQKNNARQKAYRKGLWSEIWAALYYLLRGYRIIKWRYKTKVGEIDLIAARGRQIVFVEVKARQKKDDALHAIDNRSQIRIEKAARMFIAEHTLYKDFAMRFDVMAFYGRSPFSFQHLDNAWQARS